MGVLIIGSVCVAIAVLLLVSGTDTQRATLVAQQSAQARFLADTCGEEALQDIHDNTAYAGTDSVTLGQGSCTVTTTAPDSSSKIISAAGTVDNVVRKVKIYVTIGSSSISITSWQEVGDL
jgi:hypothetical protein